MSQYNQTYRYPREATDDQSVQRTQQSFPNSSCVYTNVLDAMPPEIVGQVRNRNKPNRAVSERRFEV